MGLYGNGTMKTRVFNKLFGGPKHGARIQIPPYYSLVYVTQATPAPIYTYMPGSDPPNPSDMRYNEIRYTRRRAKFGQNVVYFYAIGSTSDAEAFEMLCNYMLRGSQILDEGSTLRS